MPGPIVHLVVQQRLPAYLRELGGSEGARYADILQQDSCSPYAAFGSMGPDFLFFSLKEYGTALDELANFLFEVYDAIEPLIQFYEDKIEPVLSPIEHAVKTVDEALFQGLFRKIGDTGNQLASTALTAFGDMLTKNVDLFYLFYPKIQKGAKESDWYWFDFLHYRRTGAFASHMWDLAKGDRALQSYVLGYVSHIATDVVGHPFVNAITGGPYRTHWHRHKLVENWIDAYARQYYDDTEMTRTCLKLGRDDIYRPDAIAGSYYARLAKFPDGQLPPGLADMIAKAMKDVYRGIDHPVFLEPTDLDTTYRLWLKWFERATAIGDALPPTPVPDPGSATSKLVRDFRRGLPSFPGGGGSSAGGGFSVSGIFLALAAFVAWMLHTLIYTTSWIVAHAEDILKLPFAESMALVKWLLYQIQKTLWEIYDKLRFGLVLGGYLFPEPRDLDDKHWGQAFINPSAAAGGDKSKYKDYPRKQESHGRRGPAEHHLLYPAARREDPQTEPAPHPLYDKNPEAFISQPWRYDSSIEKLFACTVPYGSDESATEFVNANSYKTAQLGSAVSFSARLITEHLRRLPNFNLDGDRGYGWKTWEAHANIERNNPVDAFYRDQ